MKNKITEENKNINLVDEDPTKEVQPVKESIKYEEEETETILFVKKRYDEMKQFKQQLGIDNKCTLYDRLYTPHRLYKIKDDAREFEESHLKATEDEGRKANKSKPIAFEKIQTALAIIIKQNPKAFMKAFSNKFRALNEIVKTAYEQNWDENRLLIEFRKFVFHMAKYGIAYGRRYIKKEYKIQHTQEVATNELGESVPTIKKERVVDFYDTIFETVHPKNVLLDDCCDNPRNARDCFFVWDRSLQQLKDKYPVEKFPRMKFITKGRWLKEGDNGSIVVSEARNTSTKDKYEEAIYENKYKDVRLTFINGVLIDTAILPAHQLSLVGDKWAEKDETYDGIGICQVLENYLPLIDEISNSDIDLVREMIDPTLYIGNGLSLTEPDADTVGGKKVVQFEGDINQMKWDRPTRTGDADQKLEALSREVDDATGISKDLSAISDALTLGQASYNRENSLRRLSLPLESLKYVLEDDANKALPLLKIVNESPLSTYEIEDEKELAEAIAAMKENPQDERFVLMPNGKIVRRLFKEMEMNVEFDEQTKMYKSSQTAQFWEMIPKTFDWKGKINIIPMSFLNESEAMEQQATLQDLNILLPIQDLDANGQPVLIDENGVPHKINKVKLLKDYVQSRKKNKEEYIIPLEQQNVAGTMETNTMTNPKNLQPTQSEKLGLPKQ